ncbi:MAG: methionyl-tRNA synthetase [Bryobacterales bacterium]|nr:methionyl-tRNA synthetase [Bryobacterales bacterium]
MSKYYLTTPIYYVNAAPHIGHTYTTIAADAIKRLKRMQGFEPVILTTGTDEHGQKIERAAAAAGKSPQKFTDIISEEFRRQWEALGLQTDRFQRTTDPKHARVVQDLFDRCLKNGYVYKGNYTGQYCVFDELYVSEAKPGDPCPDCGRPTETVTEENFYFKLSAFQDRLLKLYEEQPDFILPETRRNEVIAFVKQGLRDLSISRTTIKWGIPVEGHAPHVFYVWFDALSTYMSAVDGENLWPADLHLIGKEIVRFHAVYWPAFLWAAGLPLPKRIFAHGWLLFENDKMSKSKGNMVRATPIKEALGADALRYFLLREVVFGHDGNFSYDALVQRYNSDLANGLGNLASRTLALIHQNHNGKIPDGPGDPTIAAAAKTAVDTALDSFESLNFSKALESIWGLISAVDKFIVERAPWNLAKSGDTAKLADTLYTAAEALRIVTALVYPVIPESAAKIWAQLGFRTPLDSIRTADLAWGQLASGQEIEPASGVFPRADVRTMIEKMKEGEAAELVRQQTLMGVSPAARPDDATKSDGSISIEDFAKVDLRVGEVKTASAVKGADKLLHLQVDIGEPQPRSIVAGIALAYKPESLVGRKVVIVANLAPRKLRGLESQGMIVAASLENGNPVLASFLEDVPVGARLK